MLALFTFAIFTAATLLFLVQPMAGKIILPLLGGTPAVWTTSMLFFQAALLAGYTYAHLLGRLASARAQVLLHLGLLAAAGLLLPIGLAPTWTPAPDGSPILWTLATLALMVGGPFLAISASGPLLQKWFSRTDHPHARDPYFLYAASNAGSMLALLGYPTLIEPHLGVRAQAWAWAAAYVLLMLLFLAAGLYRLRREAAAPPQLPASASAPATPPDPVTPPDPAPSTRTRLLWVALAASASSLMLGGTTYLTLDVASAPLLWIIPLALYLLTFILAFAPGGPALGRAAGWLFPVTAILVAVAALHDWRAITPLFAIHLATIFLGAMQCHGRLAQLRPPASRLTEFYLLLALGGMIGGVFNAIAAPLLFSSLLEYPLALVAILLLRAPRAPRPSAAQPTRLDLRLAGMLDVALPLMVAAAFILIASGTLSVRGLAVRIADETNLIGWTATRWEVLLGWLVPSLFALLLFSSRARLAAAVFIVLLAPPFRDLYGPDTRYVDRTFFGVLRVIESGDPARSHALFHGRIMHGRQFLESPLADEPTTYYSREGPVGDLFAAIQNSPRPRRVACVGMGTASLAQYGRRDDAFTFYEIDPGIVAIARDESLFTYYANSPATKNVILGDARLTLSRAQPGSYDAILVDAFSSDAIPVHLITREAVAAFLSKLRPGGLLAYHITNRYIDLEPVLESIATADRLEARVRDDTGLSAERRRREHATSTWVILTRGPEHTDALGPLADDPRWRPLRRDENLRPWTDDYSDLLRVMLWR